MAETKIPLALNLLSTLRGVSSVTVLPTETGSEGNTGSLTNVPGAFVMFQFGTRYGGMEIAVGYLLSHN